VFKPWCWGLSSRNCQTVCVAVRQQISRPALVCMLMVEFHSVTKISHENLLSSFHELWSRLFHSQRQLLNISSTQFRYALKTNLWEQTRTARKRPRRTISCVSSFLLSLFLSFTPLVHVSCFLLFLFRPFHLRYLISTVSSPISDVRYGCANRKKHKACLSI
jgi:hypothetical protein